MRLLDRISADASALARDVFDGCGKSYAGPGLTRTALARARNGSHCNPAYRIAGWLVALRRAGASRAKAERLVGWMASLVDSLWSADDRCIRELSLAEAALDASEDLAQLTFQDRPDCRDARREWLLSLERHHAKAAACIRALRAAELELTEAT